MRTNLLLIGISLLLLCVCCGVVLAMHTTSHRLIELAELAASSLPDDPQAAMDTLTQFETLWSRTEPKWQFVAIHEDLSKIGDTLLAAQDALRNGDLAEAALSCDRLPQAVEELMKKEQPTPGNIFRHSFAESSNT